MIEIKNYPFLGQQAQRGQTQRVKDNYSRIYAKDMPIESAPVIVSNVPPGTNLSIIITKDCSKSGNTFDTQG